MQLPAWLAPRYRPDRLLSSTLVRARQTAEVIANRLSLPAEMTEGLEEAEFQYWDELPYRWQHPLEPWRDHWQPNPDTSPLYSSFRARVRDTLADIVGGLPPDRASVTLLLVTHGGVIGTLMRGLFGGHHVAVFTANTGVTQFSWELNHWRLVYHNQTSHLDTLEPHPSQRAGRRGASVGSVGERADGPDHPQALSAGRGRARGRARPASGSCASWCGWSGRRGTSGCLTWQPARAGWRSRLRLGSHRLSASTSRRPCSSLPKPPAPP